jgi:hypothetical protein
MTEKQNEGEKKKEKKTKEKDEKNNVRWRERKIREEGMMEKYKKRKENLTGIF